MVGNIDAIIIYFENGEKITVDKKLFSNFYIGYINDNCEELPYKKILKVNALEANLFTLKIDKIINNYYNYDVLKRISVKNDIVAVSVVTQNKYMYFSLASDAEPFSQDYHNNYEESFFIESHLCLLISEFKLKYKKYLFV